MSRWGDNPFRRELVERLERQEASTDVEAVGLEPARGRWVARCGGREVPPAFLQGRRLVVDVTDRALVLYPLGFAGRFRVAAGFTVAGRSTAEPAELVYGIGATELTGPGWRVVVRVSTTLPVVELELAHDEAEAVDAWFEDAAGRTGLAAPAWRTPPDLPIDEVIARNNSAIPDPLPLPAPRAGILARRVGDRIVLALGGDPTAAGQTADEWEAVRPAETRAWDDVAARFTVEVPDEAITRQAAYSLHASLFSRSVDEDGRDIFLHGRRDRGYADTAHLHQSFQMHLPALAAGEGASVRDELLAFLRLQRPDGWIERAPRPVAGSSTYVGRYTSAHLLMAVERYLAWTGDVGLLDEKLDSRLDPVPRTVRERVDRAAADLLAHRYEGLVEPCGWADAWNPTVRAQGQISAAAVIGLRAWAGVLEAIGDAEGAVSAAAGADGIAERMRALLLDPRTGIVAEHLFDDGPAGGSPDDYWAHTQIWSALAGVTGDGRGLDLVAAECLDNGVAIAPESAFDSEYVAASTDSEADLPVDSTATWLLARWPEVTHLYAMAELDRGRPDAALAAVRQQLPETLHTLDAVCAPWYYAEKYLYPGTRPWLCTWAGDPSLLEVVVAGFFGVHATLAGLVVHPRLPSGWLGRTSELRSVWRGRPVVVRLDPRVAAGRMLVGQRDLPTGTPIAPQDLGDGVVVTVSSSAAVAQTIAS